MTVLTYAYVCLKDRQPVCRASRTGEGPRQGWRELARTHILERVPQGMATIIPTDCRVDALNTAVSTSGSRDREAAWQTQPLEWRFKSPARSQGAVQVSARSRSGNRGKQWLTSTLQLWLGLGYVGHTAHDLLITIPTVADALALAGPVLMTVGPWKPIRLEAYTTRITDLDIRPRVNEKLGATIDVTFELSRDDHSVASVSVKDAEGKLIVGQSNLLIKSQRAEAHFKLSPGVFDLWYPVGYGKQPIYTVQLHITDKASRKAVVNHAILIRTALRMVICWTARRRSSPFVER